MSKCVVENCEKKAENKGFCGMHAQRLRRIGTLDIFRRANGTGNINAAGYVDIRVDNRRTYEHVHVAETALCKRLPAGVVVHHVDENRANNKPSNLVICPDDAYHKLLHRRMEALAITGDANKLKCSICKKYDDPQKVKVTRKRPPIHPQCARDYANARYARSRG